MVNLHTETPVADCRLFFEEDRQVSERPAATAVFLRHVQREKAEFGGFVPQITVYKMLLVPALLVRDHFLGEEASHVVAKELQIGVHPGGSVGLAHGLMS
ncbi:hypothetical protein D9M71_528190 [compost metagenome]